MKRVFTALAGILALSALIAIIYVFTGGDFFSPSLWLPDSTTNETKSPSETEEWYYISGSHKYYPPEVMEKDKIYTTKAGKQIVLTYESTRQNDILGPLYLYSDGYSNTYLFDSEDAMLGATMGGEDSSGSAFTGPERIPVAEAVRIAETYVYIREWQYDYDNMVMCEVEVDESFGAYYVYYHSTCGADNSLISWHCKVTVNFDGGIRYFTYVDADYFETLDYGIVKDVSSRDIEDFVRGSLAGVYDGDPIILQSRLARSYPEYFVVVTVELNGKVKGLSDIADKVYYDTTGDTTTVVLSFSVGC